MIIYNNIYKGPLEFEKFAFNIFTLHNIANDFLELELKDDSEYSNLVKIKKDFDKAFDKIVGKDGMNEKIYLLNLKYKEYSRYDT